MGHQYFQWKHGASRKSGQPGFLLWLPYDEDNVRRLKALVPPWAREWHEDNSTWWVHRDYADAIEDIFPGFLVGVDSSQRLPGFDEDPPDID